jgi:hypothetical protein
VELTEIGIAQVVVGLLIVLVGSTNSAFFFLIVCTLLEGSAAILLPALGGSSIPPGQFALLFVFLRIIAPKGGLYGYFPDAVRANSWLLCFCLYGIAMSYIGPRLFAGSISVFPMRPDPAFGLFYVTPLQPTSQNLTAGIYMLGTLLTALAAYVFARREGAGSTLVSATIFGGWFFILSALIDIVTRGTPLEELFAIFRNGDYVQLSVEMDGFVRIRGFMPEASSYAGASFVFFVANAELWYRSIRSRQTGFLAIVMALILILSTSSTAYVSLAAYLALLVLRALLLPGLVPKGKIGGLGLAALAALFFIAVAMVAMPEIPDAIYQLIVSMTVEKSTSSSGQQRLFWALQGLEAFKVSFGLGVGPGSFRSSSLLTAIIGSMGVIGIASFARYLLAVVQPARRSTWGKGKDRQQTVGSAFGCAAAVCLVPGIVGSAQASPGAAFAIFAGAALAFRPTLAARAGRGPDRHPAGTWSDQPAAETA